MNASVHIVPAGTGAAFRLRKGQFAQIRNLHGSQVVDAWAVATADPSEYMSMEHTRSINSNIFFEAPMRAVSTQRRPMLTLIEDTSPGRHDTLLCPCNAAIYAELKCKGYHRSCTDNLHAALGTVGIVLPFTPASLNLFMNVPVRPDGSIDRMPPASKPGDHVVLRAEMDLILVMSACPQDVTPINGAERTPHDIACIVADAWPFEAAP